MAPQPDPNSLYSQSDYRDGALDTAVPLAIPCGWTRQGRVVAAALLALVALAPSGSTAVVGAPFRDAADLVALVIGIMLLPVATGPRGRLAWAVFLACLV